jgi:cell division protein FtsN
MLMLVVALQSGGWQCNQVGKLWRCEPAVEALPAAPVAVEAPVLDAATADERVAVEPEDASAYFVQIGAYRIRENAEAEARRVDRDGLTVVPTERDGETLFVVLLGAFSTLAEARAAGDACRRAFPGTSYWVRTGENLRRVLKGATPR